MDSTMQISYNAHKGDPLDFLKRIITWLASFARGETREPIYFTWSSVLSAVRGLRPEEEKYLQTMAGTNSTAQLLAIINISRQNWIVKTQPLLDEFYDYKVYHFLILYIPPVLLAIGTLGNMLSLVVLRSKPMAGVSSYSYLAMLAITDTVVLYTGLLRIWLMGLTGEDYIASADWICKASVLFGYTASDLSVWLIIAVTVERYIVVCLPFRANSMCNVSRAKRVICFMFFVILAINFHFLWTVEVKESDHRVMCMAGESFVGLVDVVWPWVDAIIYSFLPFIIIVVLNIFISKEVMGAQSKRSQMAATDCTTSRTASINLRHAAAATHEDQRRHQHSQDGTRLTVMLLTVSFTFLLLTLPVNILLIFTYYWNSIEAGTTQSSFDDDRQYYKRLARFHLVKAIIDLLMYLNHSINFFLYCAMGQKFRRQILCLARRCVCRPYTASGFSFRRSARRTSGSVLGNTSEITISSRCGHRASSCVSFDMAECSLRLDCSNSSGDECTSLKETQGKATHDCNTYLDGDINSTFHNEGCSLKQALPKEKKNTLNRLLVSSDDRRRPSNNANQYLTANTFYNKNCRSFLNKGKKSCSSDTHHHRNAEKPLCKVYFSSSKKRKPANGDGQSSGENHCCYSSLSRTNGKTVIQ